MPRKSAALYTRRYLPVCLSIMTHYRPVIAIAIIAIAITITTETGYIAPSVRYAHQKNPTGKKAQSRKKGKKTGKNKTKTKMLLPL